MVRRATLWALGLAVAIAAALVEGTPEYPGKHARPSGAMVLAMAEGGFAIEEAAAELPKVSKLMWCLINLALQYFTVYTLTSIVRTVNQVRGEFTSELQVVMEQCCNTVNYAPMLCILFLAAHMRGVYVDGFSYKFPAALEFWMIFCTLTMLCQTLFIVLLSIMVWKPVETDRDGHLATFKFDSAAVTYTVMTVRTLLFIALYAGFAFVVVGIISIPAPTDKAISPAVSCTVNLCVQFFAIYLVVCTVRLYNQYYKVKARESRLECIFRMAGYTVNIAPMLCVLFIAARMRALQVDPKNGHMQSWANVCFYMCTYAVLAQTIGVLMAASIGGNPKKGTCEGDVEYPISNSYKYLSIVISALRYIIMFSLYGGYIAVIVSIKTLTAESVGVNGVTPTVSPALQCVINLTIQFFTVYALVWMWMSMREHIWGEDAAKAESGTPQLITKTLESARATTMFCPMLSILFLAARLRALMLTDQKCGPQAWAQDCMFIASYAVLGQLFIVGIMPLFTRTAPAVDEEGRAIPSEASSSMTSLFLILANYGSMLAMYGGVVAVLIGIFILSPDTANCDGAGSVFSPAQVGNAQFGLRGTKSVGFIGLGF